MMRRGMRFGVGVMKIDKARMRRTNLRRAQVLLVAIDRDLHQAIDLVREVDASAETHKYLGEVAVACERAHDSIDIDMRAGTYGQVNSA